MAKILRFIGIKRRVKSESRDKWWGLSEFNYGTWSHKLEDIHAIIRDMAICEDHNYPHGEGRELLRRFLDRCVDEDDFEVLFKEFWPEKDYVTRQRHLAIWADFNDEEE